MADFDEFVTQVHQLLDTARTLNAESRSSSLEFVNTELDLSKTFAEGAMALFLDGRLSNAKLSALLAQQAYQTGRKFLPGLGAKGVQRRLIDAKLASLAPLIEKLSEIRHSTSILRIESPKLPPDPIPSQAHRNR